MMAPIMNTAVQPHTTASEIQFIFPYSANRISSTAWVNGLSSHT